MIRIPLILTATLVLTSCNSPGTPDPVGSWHGPSPTGRDLSQLKNVTVLVINKDKSCEYVDFKGTWNMVQDKLEISLPLEILRSPLGEQALEKRGDVAVMTCKLRSADELVLQLKQGKRTKVLRRDAKTRPVFYSE